MKDSHVTDEVLQAYVLKEMQDEAITRHLSTCADCREQLKGYQHIVDSIQGIKPEAFSFDVTSVVMEKIRSVETQKERTKNRAFYIFFSTVSLVAIAMLYPYVKTIFTQLKSFSVMTTMFLLVSVLGVVIFLLTDLFRQYKQKEMWLSQ